ncbi:MAG: hypothetical protein KC503_40355 [Myxococcales bacterium]|nr:hypothetical protein [Myxococcales bacterium]
MTMQAAKTASSARLAARRRTRQRLGALLLALLFVIGCVAEADARRRRRRRRKRARPSGPEVVLLSVAGPQARRAYRGLYRGLRRRVRLVGRRKFFRAVKKLGVDPTSKGGLAAACDKAGCKFVVRGVVKRARRRRYELTISVTHAATGSSVFEKTYTVRRARRLTRSAIRAARALATAVRDYTPPPPPPPPPPPKPPEPPKPVAKAEPDPATIAKKPDDGDDGDTDKSSKKRDDAMIVARVGVGISTRDLKLVGPSDSDQRKHGGGVFPELTIAAEIYPLVPLTKSFARHIGVWVTFSQALAVSTQPAANLPQDDPGGTARQILGGVLARVPIGPLELRGAVGLGVRDFPLDDNSAVPSMSYRFVDISVGGSIPLGTPLAVFSASFAARPLVGAGQDTANALGELDGGFAFAVGAGFSGRLSFGLMYFARFEFQSYNVDYAGLGGTARPPLPGTFERAAASNAVDRYIRAWAGLGYVF